MVVFLGLDDISEGDRKQETGNVKPIPRVIGNRKEIEEHGNEKSSFYIARGSMP